MNRLINLVENKDSAIPSDQEIQELENKVKAMKAAREEAKRRALVDIRSVIADIPNALKVEEIIWLMSMLNNKLKSNHRKVRGSPVSDELKHNLVTALKTDKHTLAELSSIFDLSVSYIARIKKELGMTTPRQTEQAQPALDGKAA